MHALAMKSPVTPGLLILGSNYVYDVTQPLGAHWAIVSNLRQPKAIR